MANKRVTAVPDIPGHLGKFTSHRDATSRPPGRAVIEMDSN